MAKGSKVLALIIVYVNLIYLCINALNIIMFGNSEALRVVKQSTCWTRGKEEHRKYLERIATGGSFYMLLVILALLAVGVGIFLVVYIHKKCT